MSHDLTSFQKDDFSSLIKQFDDSVQRSQILASQTDHINKLQTQQISKLIY